MLKYATTDISDVKLGNTDIQKVMFGAFTIWERGGGGQLPCFEVVSSISSATGQYTDVYCTGDSKWYKKNNLSQYEEYGVYEQVASLASATYYVGKLVILTTDNHEYRWTGSDWEDLGSAGLTIHSPEYISRTSSATGYVPLGQKFQTDTVVEIDFQMTNDRGYAVVGDYWGNDNDDWRFFVNYSNGGYRGICYDFDTTRLQTTVTNTKARFHYDIGNYYVRNHGSSTNILSGTAKTNVSRPNQMYLFHMDGPITQVNEDYGNVYMLKITNGGILAKDFIPWTDLNGNYGLFDKVSNTVYPSTGQMTGSTTVTDVVISSPPVEYDTKVAPPDYVTYSTLEELELMECPWVGMHAIIGTLIYEYTANLQWEYTATLPLLEFVAQEDTTFQLSTNAVQYSLDRGITWTTLAAATSTPTVTSGSSIMWKGTITPATTNGIGTFSSTGNFEAKGNPMSLLYGDNFDGETSLSGKNYAFCKMFANNTKLKTAENMSLPATTLSDYCYQYMFSGCTNLVTAPSSLPATTLTNYCYNGMFLGCSSLTATPTMQVNTVGTSSCNGMFQECHSLTTVSVTLSATTMKSQCYRKMFNNCRSLTTAPALPATTLDSQCYLNMFDGCSGLTTAPALPATTMKSQCYNNMFRYCTSLTTAPALPATTLAQNCYNTMFGYCTSLTTAPVLPATTLASSCYKNMFLGCSNLNYIKCLATTSVTSANVQNWVQGVSATGTFVKNSSMTSWTTGVNGIPTGWSVEDDPETLYLTFKSQEDSTFQLSNNAVDYSLDGGSTWTTLAAGTSTPTVTSGSTIMWRGSITPATNIGVGTFSATGNFEVYGNAMSLLFGSNFKGQTSLSGKNYALYALFMNNTYLKTAENMILPATTLPNQNPYCNMFNGCTALTKAPSILPATTLVNNSYWYMFYGCTSLTKAPVLPAPALASYCYYYMFYGCSSLNYIKCLATNRSASNCTSGWVTGVSSSGTFVKASTTSWTTGVNGIPTGWTVQNA